jgi:hypothetical protein
MKPKRTHTTPARRIRSLRETLAYENDWIVYKFMEGYKLTYREAHDIFTETKRWLWLCARATVKRPSPVELTLIGMREMTVIDEMWHTFVLFTPIYEQFCQRYFGQFIHHMPSTQGDREHVRLLKQTDFEGFEREELAKMRQQIRFVADELGVATIRKWFTTYGRKYTPEKLDRLVLGHHTHLDPKRLKRGKAPAAPGRAQKAA